MFTINYQSLKKIEIIVIDDGSRDLSRSIITEFSKYDSRIRESLFFGFDEPVILNACIPTTFAGYFT